jgi:hypothetical protein
VNVPLTPSPSPRGGEREALAEWYSLIRFAQLHERLQRDEYRYLHEGKIRPRMARINADFETKVSVVSMLKHNLRARYSAQLLLR